MPSFDLALVPFDDDPVDQHLGQRAPINSRQGLPKPVDGHLAEVVQREYNTVREEGITGGVPTTGEVILRKPYFAVWTISRRSTAQTHNLART